MVLDFLYFWIFGNMFLNKGKQINFVIVFKDFFWLNILEIIDVLCFFVDLGWDINFQFFDDVFCQIVVIYVVLGDELRVVFCYIVRGRCGLIYWISGQYLKNIGVYYICILYCFYDLVIFL